MSPTLPRSEPALHRLARRHGVQPVYDDQHGDPTTVSDASLVRVLLALGVDVRTPDAEENTDSTRVPGGGEGSSCPSGGGAEPGADPALVAQALAEVDDQPWRQVIDPTVVAVRGRARTVPLHLRADEAAHASASLRLEDDASTRPLPVGAWPACSATDAAGPATGSDDSPEPALADDGCPDGDAAESERIIDGVVHVRLALHLPDDVPSGVHRIVVDVRPPGLPPRAHRATLLCASDRLSSADPFLRRRGWGLSAQLYSVTSSDSWGHGDLADAGALAEHGASRGADFLLLNPLHAADPAGGPGQVPMDSPYSPVTRRFLNTAYIRVLDIPEAAGLAEAERNRLREVGARLQERLTATTRVDRAAVLPAQSAALAHLWRQPRSAEREAAFRRYCAEQGAALEDFAQWCAGRPGAVADPDFHRWCQWIAAEQLAMAQARARAAGMRLGLMLDLAVGADRHSADLALLGDQLVESMSVGAPPDMYNQQGQDWSQHPWHPRRLAEHGYAGLRGMFAAVMAHAGGVRIDHVLGLFRLWWVPEGRPSSEGAYVRYDHEAMLACLLIEAERADVVVIGEDLGTFEPWVQRRLAQAGILGTSILWFEQEEGEDGRSRPKPVAQYRPLCLAAVNTHDLPPTAGFLAGVHLDLRERLGLLTADARAERQAHAATVAAFLRAAGVDADAAAALPVEEAVLALHRLLAEAPSALHQVALVDAVGNERIQNQPGTTQQMHPNWTAALTGADGRVVTLERLARLERVDRLCAAVDDALKRPAVGIAVSYHTDPLDQPGRGDAGGLNTYVRHAARAAARAGVRMLVFTRSATGHAHVRDPEDMPGVSVVALPVGPVGPADKTELAAAADEFADACLAWLERTPVDGRPVRPGVVSFVHGHYWMSAPAARLLAQRHGAPWWHTMHTIAAVKIARDDDAAEPDERLATERRIARDADRIIANSPEEARVLVDTLGAPAERVEAIAPGVDTGTFTPEGPARWPGPGAPAEGEDADACDAAAPLRVLFAGRLQRHKGPHVLVEALGVLWERARSRGEDSPGVLLHVNGAQSGRDELDVAVLARESGVERWVSRSSPVPAPDLAAQFRAADVVAMPSFSESYGLVALEAQACSTPVLAHRVGGLVHAVADGRSGRLVEPNTPQAWADALERVRQDRAGWARMSGAAAQHAGAHDWDEYVRRLLRRG